MVHGHPTPLIRIPLEHGEIDNPQRAPALLDELEVLSDLQAQGPERIADDLGGVSAEEHEVIVDSPRALQNPRDRGVAQELDDGRLQAVAAAGPLVDLD